MYFKLALRNVRKSFKDYLIYFLTLTFSVCLFYAFNSFQEQQAVLEMTTIQSDMMDNAAMIMLALSWVVAVVLTFLIIYANNFLIKRRKKEFGLMMIMGMSKTKISKILCYETFMIGIVSLITGLFAGFLLSQGLTVLTAQLFVLPLTKFRFIFSWSSMLITILSFAIIFILVMLFNTFILGKYKCIDLLNADRKNEAFKIKSTTLTIILFVLACILLIGDYIFVMKAGINMFTNLPAIIIAGSLGTLFFFMSLSGFLLRFIQSSKRLYFRKLNMFVLRQVNSNINSNVISMSVICVMLLLGIGAFSTGLSINQTVNANINANTPFDVTADVYYQNMSFDDAMAELGADLSDIKSKFTMDIYYDYAGEDTPGTTYATLAKLIPETDLDSVMINAGSMPLAIYPLSDYNTFLQAKGLQTISLNPDEAVLAAANEQAYDAISSVYNHAQSIQALNQELKLVKRDLPITNVINNTAITTTIGLIVDDSLIENNPPNSFYMDTQFAISHYTNITLKDGADDTAFAQKIYDAYAQNQLDDMFIYMDTRSEIYASSTGLTVTFTYVGIYLGFVFLLTSCVMLALQQLSQAADNRRYYLVLNKIGADARMCSQSVNFQIAIYFMMPLSLAIVHSLVGITAMDKVIAILGKTDRLMPALMTSGIVVLIYGLYFLATCSGYKRILNQK